ncbi:hypothetical protein GF376_04805 [Candidatus Peregrinibacteria bacterium]|nr:hypothetical protein [Candidatus Peregrinibacteria bacterium]
MKIFQNLELKLLALISAIMLWLFVVGVENYVTVFPEPIEPEITGLDENLALMSSPARIKIRYSTDSETLLNKNDFIVTADATGLSAGEYQVPVKVDSNNSEVNIISYDPETITMKLSDLSKKEVPIELKISGETAEGFEITKTKLSQNHVTVSGHSDSLSEIESINIPYQINDNANSTITDEYFLKTDKQGVNIEPQSVMIEISIEPVESQSEPDSLQRKTVMADIEIPQTAEFRPSELLPNSVLVTIEGNQNDLEQIDNESLTVSFDTNLVENGIYELKSADILLPADLNLNIVDFSPENIRVRF